MILLLFNIILLCEVNADSTTPLMSTFNYMEFEQTDIPQSDIDDAVFLDIGKYTTEDFSYINSQNEIFEDSFNEEWNNEANRCFDDYTKCLLSQDNPVSVCGFNRPSETGEFTGYRTFNSYCDLYLDNCRRRYRHWKIIDNGRCFFYYKKIVESL